MCEKKFGRRPVWPAASIPDGAAHVMMGSEIQTVWSTGEDSLMAIKVYGADWCGDTRRTLQQLDQLGVRYEYINVEQDAKASAWVKEQNDGKERKPTVDVNGRVLSVPSREELETALRENGLTA